jgi:ketosteroid isomerase-like protein
MSLTTSQVDQIIDTHFMFEATDDVDGVLGSLTPDAEHHVVPSPFGVLRGQPGRVREFYATMFGDLKGEGVEPVRRLYGDGFVVDEAIWTGQIEDGRLFGCEGKRGKVSFRLLHVFEFRGDKISRENVWCDLAAIQQQLGAKVV